MFQNGSKVLQLVNRLLGPRYMLGPPESIRALPRLWDTHFLICTTFIASH